MISRSLPVISFLAAMLDKAQAGNITNPTGVQGNNLGPQCRCVPGDSCWPSDATWENFNFTLAGKLIKSEPIALSCYEGQHKDPKKCAYVNRMWPDQAFQTDQPVGRIYPYNISCPPVDHATKQDPATCTLGDLPAYVVNATERGHVESAIQFAQDHNIRLSVSSTGHDLNGRSDGYGSLGIWLHHCRNRIKFQKKFNSLTGCTRSGWMAAAIHIDGAWQWGDVHRVARANNVIVVGGGSSSPGAIGGWLSGGSHGPASRNYGLGADQLLEAEVMLADGVTVTVNHCRNTDLFRALRGGGPGFGIVLSATVKAYPNVNVVTALRVNITPLEQNSDISHLLDAVSVMLQSFPGLNSAGYAGYAIWFRKCKTAFIGNSTSGYTHSIWMIGKGKKEAKEAFAPVRNALSEFKDRLTISEEFKEYGDYWSFYKAELDHADPLGDTFFVTSRMIPQKAVRDKENVRAAVKIISGSPDENTLNLAMIVSGGQVFRDAADKMSGLNPAWRKSTFLLAAGRTISKTATAAESQAVKDDITFVKGAALKDLAPDTGGYMNEGDRNDPEYIKSFYGTSYDSHLAAKKKYDPFHVFYCPTCVGAEEFVHRPDGALCRAQEEDDPFFELDKYQAWKA